MTQFADHILSGTHAARPAATAVPVGTIYACSDHDLIYQSDGAVWATWLSPSTVGALDDLSDVDLTSTPPVLGDNLTYDGADWVPQAPAGGGGTERALVDPTGLSRSWVNQGSATETVNGAAISLHAPANAADSFRIREWAVASKPYSKIFHILPSLISSVTYPSVGVGWRESGSGKLATVVRQGDGALSWYLSKYTNETTWSAHYLTLASTAPMNWIRLSDAAAGNRTVEVSADGWNWILIHSVATDDFLTPDKFILTVNPRHATYAAGVTLDSYE